MSKPVFDLFVIGGGSGGIAAAKRAAQYGARVGLAEMKELGGTCVNVGCVPKKVMWNAAHVLEVVRESSHFGVGCMSGDKSVNLSSATLSNYTELKKLRDAYITRLNGIYNTTLTSQPKPIILNGASGRLCSAVEIFKSKAVMESKTNGIINVNLQNNEKVQTKNVLLCTGGRAKDAGIPGAEHCLNSDGFFEMKEIPKKVAIIGAGYIAVEIAGVLNAMGAETHLFIRYNLPLRSMDTILGTRLKEAMIDSGIEVHCDAILDSISLNYEKKAILLKDLRFFPGYDEVIMAIGRVPNVENIGLENLNVNCMPNPLDNCMENTRLSALSPFNPQSVVQQYVATDHKANTNVDNVYAIGDMCGKIELTPMAIASGRRLADRIFGAVIDAVANFDNVPTVVFSHPPLATIGLSEDAAIARYGKNDVNIYSNVGINLYYGHWDVPREKKTYY